MSYKSISRSTKTGLIADNLIYLGGILGPIVTIPQLIEIWLNKNASGVSVISWTAYLVGAIFWLFYGLVHKERPIIFTYGIWIIIDILIVIGAIIYG